MKIKRIKCPVCDTAVIHQTKEESNKDGGVKVTYYCGGCNIEFEMTFVKTLNVSQTDK